MRITESGVGTGCCVFCAADVFAVHIASGRGKHISRHLQPRVLASHTTWSTATKLSLALVYQYPRTYHTDHITRIIQPASKYVSGARSSMSLIVSLAIESLCCFGPANETE